MDDKNEISFFDRIYNLLKRKRQVQIGDLGVYHGVCGYIPLGSQHNLHYDVFIKVEAVQIYDNLIEVKILDTQINESEDMHSFIKHENIKYLKPTEVQWQIHPKKQKIND